MADTERGPAEDDNKGKSLKSEDDFLREARKRFDRASTAEDINRMMALEDLKFKKGDQWPEDIRAERTTQKRPCLTINKVKTFIHQITNDQRQNRPAINVSPVGDRSDPNTAKMLKGLIRQIERQSNADVAYDTGFDGAVSNGWGYWRVFTEYEDEDSFDQVIRIGRIRNPFRVYLDPDHQEPDGSDAQWGFISDMITREEYKQMYPKGDKMPWAEGGIGDNDAKKWISPTHVRIAEYFYFKTEKRNLVHLKNGHVGWEDELTPELKSSPREKDREVLTKKIHWDTITLKQVLEEHDWVGKWIPIVKCIGDEVDIEGKVALSGLIRDAKDAQRMYNYWVTAETEQVALMPKAPYIMEEGQVEGHETRWQQANQKSYPYLLYKASSVSGKPAPPPQRQPFAGPPQGVIAAKMAAAQDMQATTGIRFDATLQERTYDESGKALRELKRTGDLGNFHYVDNLARSLRHTGRILIDLIPKIYDTPRVLTILREDDTEEQVRIDPSIGVPHMNQQGADGKMQKLYNPKLGTYEVAVTIGPSYATKRAEAADSLLGFMKAVPQAGPIIGDLVAKNMDWPGAEEIAARLAAMLPPQLQAMLGKHMQDFPPEAKALIMNMNNQLQQITQQHKTALHLLGEKQTEQAMHVKEIENQRAKIDKDFEAKLTKIAADMTDKYAGHLKDIAMGVKQMESKLEESKMKKDDKKEKDDGPRRQQDTDKMAKSFDGLTEQVKKAAEILSRPPKARIRKGTVKSKKTGNTYEVDMREE